MCDEERFVLRNARHLAADYMKAILRHGDVAVDATMGNGKDTQFLCELVGEEGHVYAFDVQKEAVERTAARLKEAGYENRATLLLDGHETMKEHVKSAPRVVMFNLGWLPGAEHDVQSTADGSVPALRAALEALRPGGVLAAVLYSGKVIGDAEKQAALAFFKALPLTQYTVLVCEFANWAQTAPLPCFVIKK